MCLQEQTDLFKGTYKKLLTRKVTDLSVKKRTARSLLEHKSSVYEKSWIK